jgi:hypothetical protein
MREEAPGGLGTIPETAVEGFMQQEALRYRAALIEIEKFLPPESVVAHYPPGRKLAAQQLRGIVVGTLDAGDEVAG